MSDKLQSIILGGAVTGLLMSFLPVIHPFLGCLACIFLPLAGYVSVWHYLKNEGEPLHAGPGAGMGALAGLAAALVSGLVGWLLSTLGLAPDMQEFMRNFMESRGMDPGNMDLETQQSPAMMAVSMVISTVVSAVLGAVGGAIGASILGKKDRE